MLRKDPTQYWRLILWPRGHYKTTAVTVDIVQNILNNPDTRLLVMQATLKLTKAWVREIKSHFNGKNPKSRLLHLFPQFKIVEGDAEGFTVGARQRMELRQRTITAASPQATATGAHFDDGYFDDLVNQDNYRNVERQDQLESDFDLYQPLIDPGGFTTVTGTRYSFADLYQRIIRRNKGEWNISIRKAYKKDGTLLFPQREIPDPTKPNGKRLIGITPELLAQKKQDNPENFNAQYLNEILVGGDQLFPSTLVLGAVRSVEDKEFPKAAPSYFIVDLAESKKKGADSSVLVIAKQDSYGRVWIVDVVGGKFPPSEFVTVLLQQALIHRPARVMLEKQPGSQVYLEYLNLRAAQANMRLSVDILKAERQDGAKHIRVSSLQSQLKQKRLFLCAGIHDFAQLEQEFTEYPKSRHDDRPDCIGLAVNYLTKGIVPQRSALPLRQDSWVVQAVFDGIDESEPTTSPCGYGFV